jgi:hypothetical protein
MWLFRLRNKVIWRTPEELVEIGFERSRVVMMNEAHNGLERCIRTRDIGRRILPTALRLGVRHLAMEALVPAELAGRAGRMENAGCQRRMVAIWHSRRCERSSMQRSIWAGR